MLETHFLRWFIRISGEHLFSLLFSAVNFGVEKQIIPKVLTLLLQGAGILR